MAAGVINMSTAVYINNSDDRSNGNVMEGDDNNGEEEEQQLRGATANPVAPVDLGILSLDDEDLTLVRFSSFCETVVHAEPERGLKASSYMFKTLSVPVSQKC